MSPLSQLEPETDAARPARVVSPLSVRSAVGWALGGAVAAGCSWAVGLLVAERRLNLPYQAVPRFSEPGTEVVYAAVVGLICGLAVGIGATLRNSIAAMWRLPAAALFGATTGGLVPVLTILTEEVLPRQVGSILPWMGAGFLAGLIGYGFSRTSPSVEEVEKDTTLEDVRRPPDPRVVVSWGGRGFGPVSRLLPILAVSAGCLVAVVVGAPSPAGWAMLAVGLLGLAVAWALGRQEKRIRELERRLAERNGPTTPVPTSERPGACRKYSDTNG